MLLFLSLSPATRKLWLLPRLAPARGHRCAMCAAARRQGRGTRPGGGAPRRRVPRAWVLRTGGKGSSKPPGRGRRRRCGDDRLPDAQGDEHRGSRARRGDELVEEAPAPAGEETAGADRARSGARAPGRCICLAGAFRAALPAGFSRPDAGRPPSACDRGAQGMRSVGDRAGPFLVQTQSEGLGEVCGPLRRHSRTSPRGGARCARRGVGTRPGAAERRGWSSWVSPSSLIAAGP